jgi:hypothetical protein
MHLTFISLLLTIVGRTALLRSALGNGSGKDAESECGSDERRRGTEGKGDHR